MRTGRTKIQPVRIVAALLAPMLTLGCGDVEPPPASAAATAAPALPSADATPSADAIPGKSGPQSPPAPSADPGLPSLERGPEEAFPGRTGPEETGIFDTPQGRVALTYQRIDGKRVFQGDILLPDDVREGKVKPHSAGASTLGARWPNQIVPVEDSGLARDNRVLTAIQHWQTQTPVRFWYGATSGPRLRFVATNEVGDCHALIGMQPYGQDVVLGANCDTTSAIHEIGHALGLFHEISRTDRNSSIIVFDGTNGWANCIRPERMSQFAMFGNEGLNLGPYDTSSIMQYSSVSAFVNTDIPGCWATHLRTDFTAIPRNTALSGGDIAGSSALYNAWTMVRKPVDYDRDGRADLAVWRPSSGTWFIVNSWNGSVRSQQWGASTDIAVPGDYDGDGWPDISVWRPTSGVWYVINSRTGQGQGTQWGAATDVPVPGDYDGDGYTDRAVWRPDNGTWYVMRANGTTFAQQWGWVGDMPVPADYDGDGKTDFAVWRRSNGTWYVIRSSDGQSMSQQWGISTDIPVPGDYNGDRRTDFAVYRPSDGRWYVSGIGTWQWGIVNDVPVPGDYDGDGKTDVAVWRPSEGNWYLIQSQTNAAAVRQWGIMGDVNVQ